MNNSNPMICILALAGLVLLPAACAQQPAPSTTATAPANAPMQGMSGMSGMDHMSGMNNMSGSDHMAMMTQCADMRRQMAQGTHQNTPGMAQMMQHCDEMDRSMGAMPMGQANTPAPASTRSR